MSSTDLAETALGEMAKNKFAHAPTSEASSGSITREGHSSYRTQTGDQEFPANLIHPIDDLTGVHRTSLTSKVATLGVFTPIAHSLMKLNRSRAVELLVRARDKPLH
ncbi:MULTISPECIES: hypothetical protein [Streptomyces]|uniref:hypothetical protein n=1 Tax=Streptomyces TaxID=1883 RepID=UPI00131A6003|nr:MULTISPECIES: hypothetical protein [Streptomyces]MDP9950803.1 hypothetical protein [Streptomyces sp. DSM 41269]